MRFEDFIEIECKDPVFKKEWDQLHELGSFDEVMEQLSRLNEEAGKNELPDSVSALLVDKGIKANSIVPNSIIFYELDGKCPVKDFIESIQDKKLQAKIAKDIEALATEGYKLKAPKASYVADGIYELRTQQSSNITRIFYFFAIGSSIILTNGYVKKQQKMNVGEFERAKKYRDEYSKRISEGE